jgi:hypothetical protein
MHTEDEMDPNDIYREAIMAMVKEGIKSGFNFLTTKLSRQRDKSPQSEIGEDETEDIVEPAPQTQPASENASISWHKPATLFWLGNDLMWIQDQMYRGSSPPRILHGVENALAYSRDMGFREESLPIQNLELAKSHLQLLPESIRDEDTLRMVQQQYRSILALVKQVKFFIQGAAESQEPDFVKRRSFRS